MDRAGDTLPFQRLKTKLDELKADPRYTFMFSGMLVSDSMPTFISRLFRLPANGRPIIVPSQDIVLGLYYLSIAKDGEPGEGKLFANLGEIDAALDAGVVTLHTKIKARFTEQNEQGEVVTKVIDTTPGRMKIAALLPQNPNIGHRLIA